MENTNGLLVIIGLISIIICIFLIGKQQNMKEKFNVTGTSRGAQTSSSIFLTTPPMIVKEEQQISISSLSNNLNNNGVFYIAPAAEFGNNNSLAANLDMTQKSSVYMNPSRRITGKNIKELSPGVIHDPQGVSPMKESSFMNAFPLPPRGVPVSQIRERYADNENVTYRVQQQLPLPTIGATSAGGISASIKVGDMRNNLVADRNAGIAVAAPENTTINVYKCTANNVCENITCPPNSTNNTCPPTRSLNLSMNNISSALKEGGQPTYIKFDVLPK